MNKKLSILIIAAIIALLSVSTFPLAKPIALDDLGLVSLSHSPNPVPTNSNLTVTLTFSNTNHISSVKLFYCQLQPKFFCEITPIVMENSTGNTFTGVIHVTYPAGAILGYHILIIYSNGTTAMIPNSLHFLNHNDITEPAPEEYYVTVNVVAGTKTNKNDTMMFSTVLLTMPLLSIIAFNERKKRRAVEL